MPVPSTDTQNAVKRLRNDGHTQRRIVEMLDLPDRWRATISRIEHGISIDRVTENVVRERLGLDLLPVTREVLVCPDCGNPHVTEERCHGQAVDVVLLTTDQRVVKKAAPRTYRTIESMPVGVLAQAIRERRTVHV